MDINWQVLVNRLLTTLMLSQNELSELCGVSQQSVSNWKNGSRHPSTFAKRKLMELVEDSLLDLEGFQRKLIAADKHEHFSSDSLKDKSPDIMLEVFEKMSASKRRELIEITRRKKAEEELKQAQEEINRILSSVTLSLWSAEVDKKEKSVKYLYVSPMIEKITGYSMEAFTSGLSQTEIIHPDDQHAWTEFLIGLSEEDPKELEHEYRIIDSDNKTKWVRDSIVITPISDEVFRIDAVLSDITSKKEAEKELENYAAMLKEVNLELFEYAGAVAHGLQTPLRAICNYAEFLREDLCGKLEEEQQNYLDNLAVAVKESVNLVNSLLQLSRAETRKIVPEKVDVKKLIRDLVRDMDLDGNVKLTYSGSWPILDSEPVLLRQLFENLISNSIKFNESEVKNIKFSCRKLHQNEYEFCITDNGLGIDQKYHQRIFKIFERLHSKTEYPGEGIGLTLVSKIVRRFKGKIWLESEPDKGTKIFFTLYRKIPGSDKQ